MFRQRGPTRGTRRSRRSRSCRWGRHSDRQLRSGAELWQKCCYTVPGMAERLLPNCPCREADVIADTTTLGRDRNPLLSWFHPGAATSYRSNATFSTVSGSAHGQQCTYDASGNLITEGPGAGTPDSWSPNTNGAAHTWYDVASWQLLGWRIYNRYWQPNNGRRLPCQQRRQYLNATF